MIINRYLLIFVLLLYCTLMYVNKKTPQKLDNIVKKCSKIVNWIVKPVPLDFYYVTHTSLIYKKRTL